MNRGNFTSTFLFGCFSSPALIALFMTFTTILSRSGKKKKKKWYPCSVPDLTRKAFYSFKIEYDVSCGPFLSVFIEKYWSHPV